MLDKNLIQQAKNYSIIELGRSLDINIGKDNKALCIFHNENTPSLSFDSKTNLFKCFGCGEGGDTIKLVMKVNNCCFKEAIDYILGPEACQRLHITLKAPIQALNVNKNEMQESGIKYTDIYEFLLNQLSFPDENSYLTRERGLSLDVLKINNIKVIPKKDKYGNFYKKLLENYFPKERLIDSGLLYDEGYFNFFFYNCDSIFPFYKENKIFYLQGSSESGFPKIKNLPKIIQKPSLYFPKSFEEFNSENEVIHIVEGVIDTLSVLSMNYRAVGIIDAGIKDYSDFDNIKKFSFALIGDKDTPGFEAKLNVYEYLKRKNFKVQSINITDLSEQIFGFRDPKIKDMNDILKKIKNEAKNDRKIK